MRSVRRLAALGAVVLVPALVSAQQANDSAYTAQIRALTPTDPMWKFTTELVDHLPASNTVPTPLKVLGYVPGTVGKLSHIAEINKYMRALAAASPRVKLFSLGESDEGREMIALAIADDAVIAELEQHRANLARLADPRALSAADRARLIKETRPVYWLTGSIHSPETGSPEMLMELAYRLAVEESDFVKSIRSNVITLITPVTEVDGRDRVVDAYNLTKALKLPSNSINLIYWGKYTAHDNNRDGMVVSQRLTQNFLKGFMYWHPTVAHDLHESVAFMHTSTGTGPYNEQFDPIVVSEWHTLAYQEINELTRRGLPGVWTHGFYDGWAPNYMLAIANLHNSIGRFYETYTSGGADCQVTRLGEAQTSRRWDRPNPPVNGVRWCIRSNINYQQSGVMIAIKYVGDNRQTFLENYVSKGERMIRRGQMTAPYAFVIPRGQRHAAEAADLVNLFRLHRAEVHVATSDFETTAAPKVVENPIAAPAPPSTGAAAAAVGRGTGGGIARAAITDSARRRGGEPSDPNVVRRAAGDSTQRDTARAVGDSTRRGGARGAGRGATTVTVRAGDWIVRLDQPYTATVRTVLAIQNFKADDPSPYDDTGWTLDELRHVQTWSIADSSILSKPMQMLTADAKVDGKVAGVAATLLVKHAGDWRSAAFAWRVAPSKVTVADSAFVADGVTYPAGTYIVEAKGGKVADAVKDLGMEAATVTTAPTVRSHALSLPRIALMHTWIETQNEGWVRYALDQFRIPYTYISDQKLRAANALDKFDVVVFPHVSGNPTTIINGRPMVGPALPWKKTAATPHLGVWDETDDMRPGMGLDGAAGLKRFVERGGLLIVEGNTSTIPVQLGFSSGVSIAEGRNLRARGGVYRAQPVTRSSPILYGYDANSFAVYFNQAPLLAVAPAGGAVRGGDAADQPPTEAQLRLQPRVILRFHDRADSLLVSGMLFGPEDMVGKAAVVDAPVGNGHVVMFGIRPMWRWESQGTFALVLNAIANWNHLDADMPKRAPAVSAGGQ